ncbi:MAG: hypothetical protein JSV51_00610 [Candidatus Bathyarchaeota archaeon]|nr:MAG: hypothetical protein JSV51_00610 [Candidatus Bathyarchaeota archaeon]
MKTKIAVVTVSGKAYYLLVNELKKRNISFLSLTPEDRVPLDIKVVITTRKEHSKIKHKMILEYEEDKDPVEVVDEAIRIVKGKKEYERLVIGIDPGQNFGIAVLGDGNVIETKNCTSSTRTVKEIKDVLRRIPAIHISIRIGNGAPSYAKELWRLLDEILPENIVVEFVREEGTSRSVGEIPQRRRKRDISSAIKISQRQGRVLSRHKKQRRES